MAERRSAISGKKLHYEGFFDTKEFYGILKDWFSGKGFDLIEVENMEKVIGDKKQVEIYYMPMKKVSDYTRYQIRLLIEIKDLKKMEVEYQGKKKQINEGKIDIEFDGYLVTDYDKRWSNNPTHFFIRTMADKFFFKDYTSTQTKNIKDLVEELYELLRDFFNTTKKRNS